MWDIAAVGSTAHDKCAQFTVFFALRDDYSTTVPLSCLYRLQGGSDASSGIILNKCLNLLTLLAAHLDALRLHHREHQEEQQACTSQACSICQLPHTDGNKSCVVGKFCGILGLPNQGQRPGSVGGAREGAAQTGAETTRCTGRSLGAGAPHHSGGTGVGAWRCRHQYRANMRQMKAATAQEGDVTKAVGMKRVFDEISKSTCTLRQHHLRFPI